MKIPIAEDALLDPWECLSLLGTAGIGRVALTYNALPLIVPVQYRILDSRLLFCVGQQPVRAPRPVGSVVAFEAGGLEPHGLSGWSVQICAVAEPHEPPAGVMDDCVRSGAGAGLTFGALDVAGVTGHRYSVCALDPDVPLP